MILISRSAEPEIFSWGAATRVQDDIDVWLAGIGASITEDLYPTIPPLRRSQRFYSKLMDVLHTTFYSKCVFCESKVKREASKILRYRPFSINKKVQPNYLWLSWQWPNLYLLCTLCHSAYEKDEGARKFELLSVGKRITLDGPILERLFDVVYLNRIEKPYLIDPCFDNPEQLLGYDIDENGLVFPRAIEENVRAQHTISIFALDERLGFQRKESLQAFRRSFDDILDTPNTEQIDSLLLQCQPASEFAGMKRYYLRNWLDEENELAWEEVEEQLKRWALALGVAPKPLPVPNLKPKETIVDIAQTIHEDEGVTLGVAKPTEENEEENEERPIPQVALNPISEFLWQINDSNYVEILRIILRKLFHDVDQVIVETIFDTGYSGAHLFRVWPVKGKKGQRRSVIKVDRDHKIKKEYDKGIEIKDYVADAICPDAMAKSGLGKSGIRYPLAGDADIDNLLSLKQFIKRANLEQLRQVFSESLFPAMRKFWSARRTEVYAWNRYDLLLPANLEVEYVPGLGQQTKEVRPDRRWQALPGVGELVTIAGFDVVDRKAREIILNRPDQTFRIKVIVPDALAINLDDLLSKSAFSGRVLHTRHSFLADKIQRTFEQDRMDAINLADDNVTMFGDLICPNPLKKLVAKLNGHANVFTSYRIHGDLNLDNVLVEHYRGFFPKRIALIDFATVRNNDHVLHDFLRLEASIWLYVVSDEFSQSEFEGTVLELFRALNKDDQLNTSKYESLKSFQILHQIREQMLWGLHNQSSWREYYTGLMIYMLGALKFDNLDSIQTTPSPKMIAFSVACLAAKQLESR